MARRKLFKMFIAVLCLTLLATAGAAAGIGSIRVVDIEGAICLQFVATPDAALTEDFAGAPIGSLTEEKEAVANARILHQYAVENQIPGQTGTPDDAQTVTFDGLEQGLYLIYSLEEEAEFNPFLVKIPTVINDETIYDVEAAPKEEEPEETTIPSEPTDPTIPTEPEPDIPQTGTSVWPKYILLTLGTAAVLLGLVDLLRGREKQR